MKFAVVLLNLGGPHKLEDVYPFLLNLFSDPAIISLPPPFRSWVARFIAKRRTTEAQEIYRHLGGGSPLYQNTIAQQEALSHVVQSRRPQDQVKVFVAMRYWHPLIEDIVKEVASYQPDKVVLLPLYPQFSTTTTGSALKAWGDSARKAGFDCPTVYTCCYPEHPGFVKQVTEGVLDAFKNVTSPCHVLFSAHGLPQKVVDRGDPYEKQVLASVQKVVAYAGLEAEDWSVCYQSRVGPLKWLEPSTEASIQRVVSEGKNVILVPIAFVSEHSETLFEMDYQYAALAKELGCKEFWRVPTVQTGTHFINGLADLVEESLSGISQKIKCPYADTCLATCIKSL